MKKRRKYRSMIINGIEYQFLIGRQYIVIYSSNNEKITLSKKEMFRTIGLDETEIYVKPMFIKTYLHIKYHEGKPFSKPYRCEYCGQKKEDVQFEVDPYQVEILNQKNKYFGCEECFIESSWNI